MEKIFSIVRQRYGRSPTGQMKDLDVNAAIWTYIYVFHSSSCSSSWAKITRKICDLPRINPWNLWDSFFKWLRSWSRIRQKLLDRPRLTGQQTMWRETTLLSDRAVQSATAKTYVFSDSVLCLGGNSNEPVNALETRMKWFLETTLSQRFASDRRGADGVRVENFHRIHYIVNSREIQKMMTESKREPEQFKGSSSCQCTMTLIGEKEGTKNIVLRLLSESLSMHEDSRKDIGRFWGLDPKRNVTKPTSTNWMENGIKLLKAWWSILPKADILYFVPAAPSEREELKSKGKRVKSIHFFGSDETIELISSVSTVQ